MESSGARSIASRSVSKDVAESLLLD